MNCRTLVNVVLNIAEYVAEDYATEPSCVSINIVDECHFVSHFGSSVIIGCLDTDEMSGSFVCGQQTFTFLFDQTGNVEIKSAVYEMAQ